MSNEGFPYTFPFYFADSFQKRVRAFVSTWIRMKKGTYPQHKTTLWFPTGSSSYTCRISGNKLYFYIDGEFKDAIKLEDLTLDGNVQFGDGRPHNFSTLRFSLIDTACSGQGDVGDFAHISGAVTWLHVKDIAKSLYYSTDSGSSWSQDPNHKLDVILGFNYDNITGLYADSGSIEKYGLHFQRRSEDLIVNRNDAETLARTIVETYKDGLYTGSITIYGVTGISLNSKFRLKLPHLGFNENLNIVSYKHRIDKSGFTTTINFGSEPYDIAVKVARLEREVFGG